MAITYEVRKTIVDAVLSGKTHDEARALVDVSVSERSIYRWLEWHRDHGEAGLQDKRHGVVWKMTDELKSWLVEAIEDNPNQSARQLKEQVQETFGIKVSISHINQIRADAGLYAINPKFNQLEGKNLRCDIIDVACTQMNSAHLQLNQENATLQSNRDINDHALEIYDDELVLEIEDNLWWIQGRKAIIRRYLGSLMEQSEREIVDIGCGSGGSLDVLAEYGNVVGVEVSSKLANIARERKIGEIICGDFFELDILSASNLFTLFDVLEHIEDDQKFVEKISRTNGKSHYLLVSVPAMPILYSQHDELLHHHRRYTRVMLCDLLESNGYEVVSMSYFIV